MLNTSSVNAALSVVSMWQHTDYCIVPRPESIISKLNEHTRFNGLVDMSDADNVDTEKLFSSLNFIANGVDPNSMATTEHSIVMNDTVKFLVNNVRRYLMHTKTVAAVAINELITKVNERRESWSTPETDVELVIWEPAPPLETAALKDLVSKYAEDVPYSVKLTRLINEPANYKLIEEYLKTGNEELDTAITEWYHTLSEPVVENLWNTFFGGEVTGYIGSTKIFTKDNDVWDFFRNLVVGYDCAIFVFLMARRLAEEKHSDSAVSLEVFERVVTNYLVSSGIALSEQIRKLNEDTKCKVLVRDIIPEKKKVIVNSSVYNLWLEDETNSADLLLSFGLESVRKKFTFKSMFTIDEIAQERAFLANSWISEITNSRFRTSNYELRTAKNVLYSLFAEQLDKIPEIETSPDSGIDDVHEHYTHDRKIALLSEWKEALDTNLVYNDLENIDRWITQYVCKIRYPNRPCLEILNGIDIALDNKNKTNKNVPDNLTADEAAFMSVFVYITRWLIDQVMISDEWRKIVGSGVDNVSRHAMTAATIANMVELISEVMLGLGSESLSKTLGGTLVTPEQIGMMVCSELTTTYSHINFNPKNK